MTIELAIPTLSSSISPEDGRKCFEWSLDDVAGKTLSVEGLATPKSFRLIDCKACCDENIIRVVEWGSLDVIHSIPYVATSYVWKGNRKSHISDSFAIEGATDGDRFNIEVFRLLCATTIDRGTGYLWLDKFCIMQTNKEDKNWQIQNMANIYVNCSACAVLLGGVGGLVGVEETTAWINRSWTLQEALLPRRVYCIFEWTQGPGSLTGGCLRSLIDINGPYGVLTLGELIAFSLDRTKFAPFLKPFSGDKYAETGPAKQVSFLPMFSHSREAPLSLTNALTKSYFLHMSEDEREKERERNDELSSSIWRCAMMRTSARDRDAIFSIMGLFGVRLDPSQYKTQHEALIALLQKSMESGRKATWLAASIRSPSLIPLLPTSKIQDVPSVQTAQDIVEAHVLTENLVWYLSNAPKGVLDDSGALTIMAPLSPVRVDEISETSKNYLGFRFAGKIGGCEVFLSGSAGSYAVLLGEVSLISSAAVARFVFPQEALIMLLEPHGDRWRKVGMAAVPPEVSHGWAEQTVVIVGNTDEQLYN